MSVITIHSNVRDYSVHFQDNVHFLQEFTRFSQRLFVIDENVWRHYGDGLLSCIPEDERIVFAVSEERKGLDSVMEIYDRLMERAAKKNMTLISLGGGIVQDVTGFVASTLYRGLNWVFVPTTLLAQADSCIGSKTSLNYKGFKNLVGTFYPPAEVHIHSPFLRSLQDVDFFSGLGEVVKLHLMGGRKTTEQLTELFPLLVQRDGPSLMIAVENSLAIKQSYMEGDEFDTGRRNLLNYGHCFGHALESVSNYSIPHGQAVVVGMLFANIAAKKRGLLSGELADNLSHSLLLKALTVDLEARIFDSVKIVDAMKQDKKRISEGLVMVLMKSDYSFDKITDFSPEEVRTATVELCSLLEDRFNR